MRIDAAETHELVGNGTRGKVAAEPTYERGEAVRTVKWEWSRILLLVEELRFTQPRCEHTLGAIVLLDGKIAVLDR